MDHHGRVAEEGLGTGGRDGDRARAVSERIVDIVEVAVGLVVLRLFI
jgi:hypothetical protein